MQVFIANIHGRNVLNAKAQSLGLKAGEIQIGSGYKTIPAVGGNTFALKDQLKAAGARWNATCKIWTFETQETLEAAINSITR